MLTKGLAIIKEINSKMCEFHPDKECKFLHKCQGVGCSYELQSPERKYPTRRSPWQSGYKAKPC